MQTRYRSLLAGGPFDLARETEQLGERWSRYPQKLYYFLKHGYQPHLYQSMFHTATTPGTDRLARFRHLVAGRRGGKTLSAAWETLIYCLYPETFHLDAHATKSVRPLWFWALAKDYKLGRPSLLTFLEVMNTAGLVKDRDFKYNRTEKWIEFSESGSLLEFKSADDPQSLRGAGLDGLWIDEAAFVPNDEAWSVVRPALSDREGLLITTTTPDGTNWFYDEFWNDRSMNDRNQFSIEYVSLDNPYFARAEWEYARESMHPVVFKREYLASFHAMAGVELNGDWLKYYVVGKNTPLSSPNDVRVNIVDGKFPLRLFLGIDPAISLSDRADHFAMCLIGVEPNNTMAYIIDTYMGRIPFPDQVDLIAEWYNRYRPELVGVESNAYQRALEQQVLRLPQMVPVVPVFAKGKKEERIMAMSPFFRTGRIRVHRQHKDFIEQWVTYDSKLKNPKDDLLDATEIALELASVLLPLPEVAVYPEGYATIEDEAWAQVKDLGKDKVYIDPDLGSEF